MSKRRLADPLRLTRRQFASAVLPLVALPSAACVARPRFELGLPGVSAIPEFDPTTVVNDIHSQLNATRVARIAKPSTVEALQQVIAGAAAEGRAVAIAGG